MIIKRRLFLCLIVIALAWPQLAQAKEVFTFAYLFREADSFYEPHKGYTGLVLKDRHRPLDGVQAALRESKVLGRALGLKFSLVEHALVESETAAEKISALRAETGATVFILDLPLAELAQAARDLSGEPVLLFNVRHGDDGLRGEACSPVLFHSTPSQAMLMDALAQHLVAQNWKRVLLLEGEAEADQKMAAAFQASARKFQLKIVDTRPFVLSNDPRQRDQNNVRLLTGDAEYDVVFLADTLGEFGRFVPYRTLLPRPVVGTDGLMASAWHWTSERYGAPQLNQRFERRMKRRMDGLDWAGWAAVKSVVEAVVRSESTALPEIRKRLLSDDFTLDTYKGVPASYRAWDHQLRQAILLHSHNAVLAFAPIEGFLHQKNNLDTLGKDQPETACRMDR